MTERIIDISETSAYLKIENKLLVVDVRNKGKTTIPIGDIAALVISNPAVILTHSVLSELANAGCIVVVSDSKHNPAGMLLPLQNNVVQTERLYKQTTASLPTKKRLWQQVIRKKIDSQAELLIKLHGNDYGLKPLVRNVKSGDPENVEARASRIYWQNIFSNCEFRRDRFAEDQNIFLNYGYIVLRAMTARAICATGLHPSIGIHHHNKYNPFCLADDLMEPFRPLIDKSVYEIVKNNKSENGLDKENKSLLINSVLGRVMIEGELNTVFYALARVASSISSVFEEQLEDAILPENIFV